MSADTASPNQMDFTSNGGIQLPPEIVVLDVGGTKFKVLKSTLVAGSRHLQGKLSGDEGPVHYQEDGSIYLEVNPEVFAHLLRFMRQPNVFPLYWTLKDGFDYNLYNLLGKQATDFGVDNLATWIEQKQYLHAIRVHYEPPQVTKLQDYIGQNEDAENHLERQVLSRVKQVYVCPMDKFAHYGRKDLCGKECRKVQGDKPDRFQEEEVIEVVSMGKRISFKVENCDV